MESGRGPFNGRAQITGAILDSRRLAGVTVTARSTSTGKTMTAYPGADGQFSFSAVMPGEYEVEIDAPGLYIASRRLVLKERDRAVLSASLAEGAAIKIVAVQMWPNAAFAATAKAEASARDRAGASAAEWAKRAVRAL